jgi:hypothetical protein
LSGARRADITGFGLPEHHSDGSALPIRVQRGNLGLTKPGMKAAFDEIIIRGPSRRRGLDSHCSTGD